MSCGAVVCVPWRVLTCVCVLTVGRCVSVEFRFAYIPHLSSFRCSFNPFGLNPVCGVPSRLNTTHMTDRQTDRQAAIRTMTHHTTSTQQSVRTSIHHPSIHAGRQLRVHPPTPPHGSSFFLLSCSALSIPLLYLLHPLALGFGETTDRQAGSPSGEGGLQRHTRTTSNTIQQPASHTQRHPHHSIHPLRSAAHTHPQTYHAGECV